jgi:glutamyl-tRNA reductase
MIARAVGEQPGGFLDDPGRRLLALGLSHRTARVELREKASLAEPAARSLLRVLRGHPAITESAVLSTCNRTELFAVVGDLSRGEATLSQALIDHSRVTCDELAEASYLYAGESAARHLFRVAASLDSMVLGESEIQGQVRAARELARQEGTLGAILDRTFGQALATGRRVRTKTRVATGAVSVSSVAVDLARAALGDLRDRRALLIGAGRAAEATARALLGQGLRAVVVANRTPATASRLAARLGGPAIGLDALTHGLGAADVVISSTDAPSTILDPDTLTRALSPERQRPLVLIDIAVPRDVDPRVGELPGVRLYNIDDLERVVEANLNGRRQEAARAELIVAQELRRFVAPRRRLEVASAISPPATAPVGS